MAFTAVRRRKVHEDVAAQIDEAIISGVFAEGDQLPPERELMERFGVGRPAVREALLMLERNGILQLSAGERARVVHPTMDGLVDQLSAAARHFLATSAGERSLQQARRVFEAAMARNAAEAASENDIGKLRAALGDNRAALASVPEFEATDVGFHLAIAEIGNNQVFLAMHRAIVGWLALQRRVSLKDEAAMASALRHHEAIFEAIAARAPERAWAAMNTHLLEAERFYGNTSREEP